MKRISHIGGLLKKIYRLYSTDLLNALQEKGFIDLRPSFLEILMYVCDNEAPAIKEIGSSCGLKKQTMTSHLNELEKRGYILRKTSELDRRLQRIYLTEYGERFKISLIEVTNDLENSYLKVLGDVELDRIQHTLELFHNKINEK
jgi:DNA-binding MarR family transcriptional regulator